MTRRYDPDIQPRCFSVEQIAHSYQGTHLTIWNMPPDKEFLHALKINGHDRSELEAVKAEYCRLSRLVWTGE